MNLKMNAGATIFGITTIDGSSYIVGENRIKSIELAEEGIAAGHFVIRYDDHTKLSNVVNARFVISFSARL